MWLPSCAVFCLLFATLVTSFPQSLDVLAHSKGSVRRQLDPVEDPQSYEIDEASSDVEHDGFADFDYSPTADFPSKTVKKWIALGDSFAAGPGAGRPYDNNSTCMRGTDAYPIKLQQHANMKGPQGRGGQKPDFEFAACTGAQTYDLLATQLEGNQLKNLTGDTTIATISITGNDVRFSSILKACVYKLPRAGNCQDRLNQAQEIMYNSTLWTQYNNVVTEVINRFNPTWPVDHTLVYQQGYLQFFDETTDQCDKASFRILGPKITKDLRKTLNVLTHQLNYVVQYWMDLRNVGWTTRPPLGTHLFTALDWVDTDWRYNNHRFCRSDVKEPSNNDSTWFFHLPRPIRSGMDENEAYDFLDRSWSPELDPSLTSVSPEALPTWAMKTFHPKPAGFAQSVGMHLYKLYYLEQLSQMPNKRFYFMCVGDYTTLGKTLDPGNAERYTYIPHLRNLLNDPTIFNYGQPGGRGVLHQFLGSVDGVYQGDPDHEIRPQYDSIKAIAHAIATESLCNWFPIGKIIPVMIGHDELLGGRNPADVVQSIRQWLLPVLFHYDKDATVLLAQIPLYGIPDYDNPDREGSNFKNMQKRFIEFNARIAGLVTEFGEKGYKIMKVHTSAPLTEHTKDDRQFLDSNGNNRIAWDFLEALATAQRRGWFEGPKWDNTDPPEGDPDLPGPADDKYECIQQKADNAVDTNTLLTSLFRGIDPNDRDKWIQEKACNADVVCAFSWDNKTCVYAGGDGDRTTHHQLIVKHYEDQINVDDCKDNVKKLLECLDNNFYGGIAKGNSGYYSLTDLEWTDDDKQWPLGFVPNREQLKPEEYDKINDEPPTPRDPWDPKPLPVSSNRRNICKADPAYNIQGEIPDSPPPIDGFWDDGDEAPAPTSSTEPEPTSTPTPTVTYEDHCADTTVYTSFDYARASTDIGDFCKGGLDLLTPAAPLWYTYDHADIEMRLHIAIQWSQREAGQDGCNAYQNNNHIEEKDCIDQFLAAMNRCNTDTIEKKYGQYPMTWNSPGGCMDFWLIGHGTDWDCDNLGVRPKECSGKKKET